MKYYNLVFINHGNSSKNYLFKVHLKVSLKKGEKVFVKTSKGECIATTASDSFIVDNYTAEQIIAGTGAYKPLKDVIGWAEKQEDYRCAYFDIVDIPF